jgi:hypothetical protein
MTSTPDLLPYKSEAYVELDALQDVADGSAVTDAVVTVTLYTKSGDAVSGATDLPAPYSGGKYRAVIPHTVSVRLGATYRCEAKAVKGTFEMRFVQMVKVAFFEV